MQSICPFGLYTQLPAKRTAKNFVKKYLEREKTPMKNFTQKALMVVLTVFVLVGLFYGLSTPVKASASASIRSVSRENPEQPPCAPMDPGCLNQ
jgi:hypothetical protein